MVNHSVYSDSSKNELSRRTQSFQESVIREMTRLGEITGAVNLSQGLPDFPAPQAVLDAAVAAIRNGENQYTFPFGDLDFRKAIARKEKEYNQILANPETEITVTCGVSEAMISTILALTEPGDEIVILEPWYENYLPDSILAGVKPRFVPLRAPDYRFDPAELDQAFNAKTRLILINTPHNPTGRVFSREELQVIAGLCQKHDVIAVTDEIYEYILYDGLQHISIASLDGMADRTVTIGGLGKTFSVTGWRVGWAIACERLSGLIRKVHDYMTVCAPAPFQAAGVTALSLREEYFRHLIEQYTQARDLILPALMEAGFRFFSPEGAYYIMADYSQIGWPSQKYKKASWSKDRAFAEYIAREVGIAVVPGSSFFVNRNDGEMLVRINFAKQQSTLLEAVQRLERLSGKQNCF
jgi:aminotransferase